jgi:aminoglycoside phosphotransferase (APT) family kinase protein
MKDASMLTTVPLHTVARILGRYGLGRISVEALQGGRINASYRVDERYVLRINLRMDEHGKLAREQRVLAMLRDVMPVPEILAYDGSGTIIPQEFMIQRYVPGCSLLRRWPEAGVAERASYLAQLAALLRRLHGVRLAAFGDPSNPRLGHSWSAVHTQRAAHALRLARASENAPPELIDRVEKALQREGTALAYGAPTLTHGDLHFGNVHVQEGTITGLLDFERAWSAAPDWDLDQIRRFVHYPHLFEEPGAEGLVRPVHLTGVFPALRAGYPELFEIAALSSRLRVYALEYDLRALGSARKRHGNDPALAQAACLRLAETLSSTFPGL